MSNKFRDLSGLSITDQKEAIKRYIILRTRNAAKSHGLQDPYITPTQLHRKFRYTNISDPELEKHHIDVLFNEINKEIEEIRVKDMSVSRIIYTYRNEQDDPDVISALNRVITLLQIAGHI